MRWLNGSDERCVSRMGVMKDGSDERCVSRMGVMRNALIEWE